MEPMEPTLTKYSGVPITRAGSIKQAGRIFLQILINEQVLIRASRLEKIKILAVKLQSGRNFLYIFKNEQLYQGRAGWKMTKNFWCEHARVIGIQE